MLKASWITPFTVGVLLSSAGFADDAKVSNTDAEPLPVATLSVESLLEEFGYGPRWQLSHPVEAMAYSDDWLPPIADFRFQDGSALARVSKLRGLSLLTLAEIGQTRVFLGVNDDGLVGLHFNAFSDNGDEHYLEVVRMPYLQENELGSTADR